MTERLNSPNVVKGIVPVMFQGMLLFISCEQGSLPLIPDNKTVFDQREIAGLL